MLDYIAYLFAQQRSAARAGEALPDSPVRPEPDPKRLVRSSHAFRHGLSDGLRWIADRLEPKHQRPVRLDCPSEG